MSKRKKRPLYLDLPPLPEGDLVQCPWLVVCSGPRNSEVDCDNSLAFNDPNEAVKAGWQKVTHDMQGDLWSHVGRCPECVALQRQPTLFS